MTISRKEMCDYEITTEMRDRLLRARYEVDEVILHNKGYFEEDEQFYKKLCDISRDLDSVVSESNKVIGINYRKLTE